MFPLCSLPRLKTFLPFAISTIYLFNKLSFFFFCCCSILTTLNFFFFFSLHFHFNYQWHISRRFSLPSFTVRLLCHLPPSLQPVRRNTDGIHEASSHGDYTVATQADCPQSIAGRFARCRKEDWVNVGFTEQFLKMSQVWKVKQRARADRQHARSVSFPEAHVDTCDNDTHVKGNR